MTNELFRALMAEELDQIRERVGEQAYQAGQYGAASELFERLATSEDFEEFLTIPGYERLD